MTSSKNVREDLQRSLTRTFQAVVDNWLPEKHRINLWGLLSQPEQVHSPVLKMPPGSGKTHIATELANAMYKRDKLPTLYYVLEHKVRQAVKGRRSWNRWKGHHHWKCDRQ